MITFILRDLYTFGNQSEYVAEAQISATRVHMLKETCYLDILRNLMFVEVFLTINIQIEGQFIILLLFVTQSRIKLMF